MECTYMNKLNIYWFNALTFQITLQDNEHTLLNMEASGCAYSEWSTSAREKKSQVRTNIPVPEGLSLKSNYRLGVSELIPQKSHAVQEYIMHLDKRVTKNEALSSGVSIRQRGFLRRIHTQPARQVTCAVSPLGS